MTKKRNLLTRRTSQSPLSTDVSRDRLAVRTVRSLSHLHSGESIDQIHNRNRLYRSTSLDTEGIIYVLADNLADHSNFD